MSNLLDWLLEKMNLTEDEYDEIEESAVEDSAEKSWAELLRRKRDKVSKEEQHVYFKNIQDYKDCKLVIDNYKNGAMCIYKFEQNQLMDIQGMMNFMCGGVYALDGHIREVGDNVFLIQVSNEKGVVK